MTMWLDLMRLHTQHINDDNCKQWHPSAVYNKTIDNIETVISEKMELTLIETKVMLNYKKRTADTKEKRYFSRKNKVLRKKKKYLNKLIDNMGEMRNAVFNAHHAVVKLQPIMEQDDDENRE